MEHGTRNMEHGTWNMEHVTNYMTIRKHIVSLFDCFIVKLSPLGACLPAGRDHP